MRLIFMGSPDFAVPSLEALVGAGHEVVAVYCQPPRPAGRGKADRKTAVHERAEQLGLEVRTPRTLRDAEEQAKFAALGADLAVVAAYGLILPKPILEAPRMGCVNIHASLLPRWRGAAPIQRAILAGDTVSGVTIMQMDEGLDTGPMRAKPTRRRSRRPRRASTGTARPRRSSVRSAPSLPSPARGSRRMGSASSCSTQEPAATRRESPAKYSTIASTSLPVRVMSGHSGFSGRAGAQ